jgi:hypothetical protein
MSAPTSPAMEWPSTGSSAAGAPTIDAPALGTSPAGTPTTGAPTTDAPTMDAPTMDVPAQGAPAAVTHTIVSAEWLALRGPADAAARSTALAAAVARRVTPGPLVVHDLGSGTGAMMRWLAPRLPGPQSWVLHDGDAAILARRSPGAVTDASGRAVTATTSVEPLAELDAGALRGASLITASALLDVITLEEATAIIAACQNAGAPVFFSLSVTGEVTLAPAHPLDSVLAAAFNEHQMRVAARRQLLGPDAPRVVAALFEAIGWTVTTAATPWRLVGGDGASRHAGDGTTDGALLAAWLDGWVGAAVEQRPELAAAAAAYLRERRAQLAAGDLRADIGHEDLIAWPA